MRTGLDECPNVAGRNVDGGNAFASEPPAAASVRPWYLGAVANPLKDVAAHSANWFGDTRAYWWNSDHLAMLAGRWGLGEVRHGLDVGCGVGHWGFALAPLLPKARVVGIDREPRWIDEATRRAIAAGLGDRFEYRVGVADALPFADATFDLVTCQTLLIHVRDPQQVLREMVRVVRPGGHLLIAEPTNITDPLVDDLALGDSPDAIAAGLRFQLICQRGLRAQGDGDHLLGESLPRLLAGAGLEEIELRQNDRTWTMLPPYASPFERAQVEEIADVAAGELTAWDHETTRRYFLAGGGAEDEFSASWEALLARQRRVAAAVSAGTFARTGGGLFHLAHGRRPAR